MSRYSSSSRPSASSSLRLPILATLPLAAAFSITLALVPQPEAQAISFNFDFGSGVSDDFQRAAQEAAGLWSNVLQDDVVVDLRLEYSDLSTAGSVLGGAQPAKVKVKYEDYTNALFKDAISSTDFLGLDALQLSAKDREELQAFQSGQLLPEAVKLESKEFSFLMDSSFAKGKDNQKDRQYVTSGLDFIDANGNNNNKSIQLTRAQAKALNLVKPNSDRLDGLITLNSATSWDFDRSDGVDADKYDATSVLLHEIGHVLGVVSGVDTLEFLASTSEPDELAETEKNKFSYLTPLDFYRYSAESAELGVMDATLGGSEKYFSLDGGKTAVEDEFGREAYFSNGGFAFDGDGYQGSHWQAGDLPLGVMNPVLQAGQTLDISQLDLTLLDVVGWDLEDATPERAAALGIDWQAFTDELASDRQVVVDELLTEWGDEIPQLEAALSEASSDAELKFRQKLQKEFDALSKKLDKETDPQKRSKEVDKFYQKIDKEAEKRNQSLQKLPKEIYKVDDEVRSWLALPVDKLSEEMSKADGATINRLSNVVKSLPADEQESISLKLEEAVALFADEPSKLVEDLLDTSGPANPVGWSYFRWYWWWLESDADDDAAEADEQTYGEDGIAPNLYYAETGLDVTAPFAPTTFGLSTLAEREAQDVPEPSAALATFGIAALSLGALRKRSREKAR